MQWSALMGRPSQWNANTYRLGPSPESRMHGDDSDAAMRRELARFNIVGTTERLAEVMLCVCHLIGLVHCPVVRRESTHATPRRWPSTLDEAALDSLVGTVDRRLHTITRQRIDETLLAVAPSNRLRYQAAIIKPSVPCPLPYRWVARAAGALRNQSSTLHRCVAVHGNQRRESSWQVTT